MDKRFEQHFKELGYDQATAIQTGVEQPLIDGENVIGLAPTGSGKTVAFTLPLLEQLLPGDGTQLLVLAPSQELAQQTTAVMRDWAALLDMKVAALTGGANVKRQIEKLKQNPEIVVGTPGRVLNLVSDKRLKLHLVTSVVIDEADELLAGETRTDVEDIIREAPRDTQLSFFSATKSNALTEVTEEFGIDVKTIDVRAEDNTQGPVRHGLMELPANQRPAMLRRFSRIPGFQALVFFNQLGELERAAAAMRHEHVQAVSLAGKQRQVQRADAMRDFRNGKVTYLLTTDVAARGLDIPNLPAVINFDLPSSQITYTHRVGRTGRMGASGLVINFGNDHDLRNIKQTLRGSDYVLKPLYFAHNAFVDERPARAPRVTDKMPVAKSTRDQKTDKSRTSRVATSKTDLDTEVAPVARVSTKSTRPVKPQRSAGKAQLNEPAKKSHSHKKHSKNKGMRHKNTLRNGKDS
ncbi:DEAD/DEAH box helicase [Furfurilactobacillus siliginis]|uniref:Helicase n=1 Tax=Furfurilactobacillus siliginis TaxID=348151 RepID=A0A0R2L0N1_9LACO|nr:DEAD/DEAH box helicase [Furfurilactobacillus siliginis]KRN95339.1 superfamily II DNA RNA helicase [Furfurilactobacillus siliginis]GEK28263.1 helicase [Furfurilactobacillus siliginis]